MICKNCGKNIFRGYRFITGTKIWFHSKTDNKPISTKISCGIGSGEADPVPEGVLNVKRVIEL